MLDQWGSVNGDVNADVILRDRRAGRRNLTFDGLTNFALVAGFAIWYGITGNSVALALEIIAAAWLVVSGVRRDAYQTYTMLLIAERRVQIVEQKLAEMTMTPDNAWRN